MSRHESVSEALEGLRTGLQVDGADLVLESADAAGVVVRLTVQDPTCLDCILPAEHLRLVVAGALERAGLDVATVTVIDPRLS